MFPINLQKQISDKQTIFRSFSGALGQFCAQFHFDIPEQQPFFYLLSKPTPVGVEALPILVLVYVTDTVVGALWCTMKSNWRYTCSKRVRFQGWLKLAEFLLIEFLGFTSLASIILNNSQSIFEIHVQFPP